jgi:hypothetical protein
MTDRQILPFPSDDGPDAAAEADIAARLAALYQATPAPDAEQAARCARRVLAQAMHAPSRSASGVLRTRWWWGAAAAAVLMVTVARPWRVVERPSVADSTATLVAMLKGSVTPLAGDAVRFDLQLPTAAREVALVGDFNNWNEAANPMAHQAKDGSWSADVPLTPGRHVYAFVVDGKKWLVDPLAPQVPDDGLGPANAVVIDGLPK